MKNKAKRREIDKICRSLHDWHVNAHINWDIDKFFSVMGSWDIQNAIQYQKFINRKRGTNPN